MFFKTHPYRSILIWLGASCAMIFAMVIIGAITRLTESGLSMVEWRPLIGAFPPLSEDEWQRVFDLYRQSPEYQLKHYWMTLADFKHIFFWEWFHRLWGRLIGVVYGLPLAYFLIRKKIPSGYHLRLIIFFFLGGLQGVIGWWMVSSGLVDRPDVSHFRLAVHLSLALVIFALLLWTVFDLLAQFQPEKYAPPSSNTLMKSLSAASIILLSITIIWGAFVAGLEAGRVYNTYPLMNGKFTPESAFTFAQILHDHGWVQFFHRWIAVVTGVVLLANAFFNRSLALAGMVWIQIGLGITALLTQLWIPAAALHQAGALVLLGLTLHTLHKSWYAPRIGDENSGSKP